jgi:hypothetical protein
LKIIELLLVEAFASTSDSSAAIYQRCPDLSGPVSELCDCCEVGALSRVYYYLKILIGTSM